jgi:putative transposase
MDEYETLNHTTWDSKYHVIFIPKYRRKVLYREVRKPRVRLRHRPTKSRWRLRFGVAGATALCFRVFFFNKSLCVFG